MNYFDIHSHLYFPDYDADRDQIIAGMTEQGIWTTAVGTNTESSRQAVALADKYNNIYATVGQHPDDDVAEQYISELESLVMHPKVVAVGECGFDFFRTPATEIEQTKLSQRNVFESQIDLALRYNKALMIHARPSKGTMDAYEETLAVLEPLIREHGDKLWGDVHFFAGNMEILKRFLGIGFTVSFTGVITFARDYDEVLRYAPLSMIHAETDAPFVAPLSHRGQRNSSEYVPEVVEAVARIRGEDIEVVKTALIANAKRLFRIE